MNIEGRSRMTRRSSQRAVDGGSSRWLRSGLGVHLAWLCSPACAPKTLDHVAFWVADRDADRRLRDAASRHARDRRSGQLHARRLRRAARQADALRRRRRRASAGRSSTSRCGSPISTRARRAAEGFDVERRESARPTSTSAEGLRLGLVEAPTDIEYDLDHVALYVADPEATAEAYEPLGFRPASRRPPGAARRGRRRVRRVPRGRARRARAAAAQPPRRPRRLGGRALARGRGRSASRSRRRRRGEHVRRLRLGPGARQDRVRRAQADVLARREPLARRRRRHGRPRAPPRARASSARRRRLREGRRAGRLDAALVLRRLALPDLRRLPRGVPGRRPGAAAACSSGSTTALAWLESLGAPVVGSETGNPRTSACASTRAALTDALVAGAAATSGSGGSAADDADAAGARHRRLPGRRAARRRHIAPAAPLRVRANPWSDGRRPAPRARARRGALGGHGRVLRPRDAGAAGCAPRSDFVAAGAAVRPLRARLRRATARSSSPDRGRPGRRSTSSRRSRASPARAAWYVVDDAALGERIRERTVARHGRGRADAARSRRELPFELAAAARVAAVRVKSRRSRTRSAASRSTEARVLDVSGAPIDGLYAAGADAGGDLRGRLRERPRAALVLGRIAAETRRRGARRGTRRRSGGRRPGAATARPSSRRSRRRPPRPRADLGRLAVALAQLVAGRLRDEEQVATSPMLDDVADPRPCAVDVSARRSRRRRRLRSIANG